MKLSTIASGSSGNCIYMGSGSTHILIDVGVSKKKIEAGLKELGLEPQDITAILVTHEHSDHISGIGVMSRAYEIPIYGTKGTIEGIMSYKNLGKMPEGLTNECKVDEKFTLGDLSIEAFTISHDANEPSGYVVEHEDKKAAVVTDLGTYDDYTTKKLEGLDAIFLEANHDSHMVELGPYPFSLKKRVLGQHGHLSNELSGRLLCDILHKSLKYVVLSHISKDNNYELLAYETVKLEVLMSPVPFTKDDFELIIANRDGVKDIINI